MGISLKKNKLKFVFFSLLPAFLLFLLLEGIVRFAELSNPFLCAVLMPGEVAGLYQQDHELFWSLRPHLNTHFQGVQIITNSIGLRNPEILPKRSDEFRILSLGESTTFGAKVLNTETYSAQLETLLNSKNSLQTFTVINAGLSAYSSFQSLQYLKERGLGLKPDLILFYHELNDYLPSYLRNSKNTEIGVLKTDKQLWISNHSIVQKLLHKSALFRFLKNQITKYKILKFSREKAQNPALKFGIPPGEFPPLLISTGNKKWVTTPINEQSLGQRVSETERIEILQELRSICIDNDIALVVIHPTYRGSTFHECVLTRFCHSNEVFMFEAHYVLHPFGGRMPSSLFLDPLHPSVEGHKRLAEELAHFIWNKVLHKETTS